MRKPTPIDRRLSTRYSLDCPITLKTATGQLRDISTGGLSLDTNTEYRVHDVETFMICFSHSPWLRCTGEVLRVNEKEGCFSVAVAYVGGYEFVQRPRRTQKR